MQQPREPELQLNQVQKAVNLVELVLTLGYQHIPLKNGSDPAMGKFHTFAYKGKPGLDQVIVYKSPTGDYLYFNRADDRDKGSVIDFFKNRLENPRIKGIVATPGRNVWASILENAERFLGLPLEQRRVSPQLQQSMAPVQRGDNYIPEFLRQTTPLTDTRYLRSRGLSEETLSSPFFVGRILNQVQAGVRGDGEAYKFTNTVFPQLCKDSIVGLEIKANGYKGPAADSLASAALWLSNTTSKTTTLVVTPSALDALSHYQLKQPTNALYASTSGQLTENQVAEIKRLVENNAIKTVKLSLANNLEGHLSDIRLLAGLARPASPMRLERTQPSLLTLAVYSVQDEPITRLIDALKAYNQQVTETYRQVAGQAVVAATATLDSEFIKAGKVAEHSYQFHVPKRLETLAFFNQALLNSFPMVARLELDKAKANNWNDHLRQELKGKEQVPAQTPEVAPRRRPGPRV
jgi:hypothetical protein